ncbi:MAG: DNA repair protein RecO [Clostridia bacterium]|nr:DNA repair protein RecO [Clostridia bacterium]
MNITIEGLVLRTVNYKESDKILTVLTRDRGCLTVKAQGARRKGSRLGSCTQLFCHSELSLYERDGRFTLDEGDVKNQFYGLSRDIEKMALASYFAQILLGEPEDGPASPDIMRLALNSFYALEKGLYPQAVIKAAFELRYMALNGYAPDLSACASCGKTGQGGYIDLQSGLLVCPACFRPTGYRERPMDEPALGAARYILGCDLKRLFSYKLPERSMAFLARFCEDYLQEKTEQHYKTLDFYKSLFPREEPI